MADSDDNPLAMEAFFRRWEASGAAERANYSMFLNELCDLLEVTRPDPAGPDDVKNAYVFESAVPFPNPDGSTTVRRIDLYKRDCFVLEAKQGAGRRRSWLDDPSSSRRAKASSSLNPASWYADCPFLAADPSGRDRLIRWSRQGLDWDTVADSGYLLHDEWAALIGFSHGNNMASPGNEGPSRAHFKSESL